MMGQIKSNAQGTQKVKELHYQIEQTEEKRRRSELHALSKNDENNLLKSKIDDLSHDID